MAPASLQNSLLECLSKLSLTFDFILGSGVRALSQR